jgi:hypothetical protein
MANERQLREDLEQRMDAQLARPQLLAPYATRIQASVLLAAIEVLMQVAIGMPTTDAAEKYVIARLLLYGPRSRAELGMLPLAETLVRARVMRAVVAGRVPFRDALPPPERSDYAVGSQLELPPPPPPLTEMSPVSPVRRLFVTCGAIVRAEAARMPALVVAVAIARSRHRS